MAHGKRYVIGFAAVVCIAASTLVSLTSLGLRQRQETNIEVDRKAKILKAAGLEESLKALKKPGDILALYKKSISTIYADSDKTLPVYLCKQKNAFLSVVIPVSSKGLWPTLYGYFALEPDLNTVKGLTFYKHGETPGLGGEIEKEWFQQNFVGKKIWDNQNNLVSIKVIKGKVDQMITDPEKRIHSVDGISGATITSRGVTDLLKKWLDVYEPFIIKVRQKGLKNAI